MKGLLTMSKERISDLNITLFTDINSFHQLKLFDYVSPQNLDVTYNSLYSKRFLSNIAKTETNTNLAIYIDTLYGEKWDNIILMNEELLKILKTGNVVSETEETSKTAYTRTIENQLASYDTNTYSNESKEIEIYTPDSENSDLITKIRTSKNAGNLDFIYKRLHDNIIRDIIYGDINKVLTLRIYKQESEVNNES